MHLKLIALTILFTAMCLGANTAQSQASDNDADMIFVGGEFYTANPRQPWASAVAVRGDSIIYVGDEAGAADFVGPATSQYQLNDALVIPGIVDAHTHPGLVARSADNLQLADSRTQEELMAAIAAMVKDHPQREIIVGGGWDNDLFGKRGPHKSDLDRIESERPLVLYDVWGHSLWANSKALEVAGVDRDTADVIPGLAFYQRDEDGEPSGWITEAASIVFSNKFQTVSESEEQPLMDMLVYLRDLGVTTLWDAGNFGWDDEVYSIISRWDKEGILPLRYHGSYTLFLPKDLPNAVNELKRMRQAYGSDRVRIDTLKVFLDGVIETRTADMSEDYLDTPGNSGQSLLSEAQLIQLILDLHEEDLDMHIHAVGDQAIHNTLNAVEQVKAALAEPLKTQVTICHLEVMRDSDFNRFKDLGVIASYTPHWHGGDEEKVLKFAIGDHAFSHMRAQPVISDGARFTFSSDITTASWWRAEQANPFVGIQTGHNKQYVDGGAQAHMAPPRSDRIALDDLVDGYTRNGAFQLGRADQLGSLEVGKRADLVVLDRNLFEVNRYDIHTTRPTAVVMDGVLVHGSLNDISQEAKN